jgi:hypothetical protein
MIGALSCTSLGERLGRRKIIFLGALVMIGGSIIQAASFGLAQFIVGRIVTGFGNGFITATVPVWQSYVQFLPRNLCFCKFSDAEVSRFITPANVPQPIKEANWSCWKAV